MFKQLEGLWYSHILLVLRLHSSHQGKTVHASNPAHSKQNSPCTAPDDTRHRARATCILYKSLYTKQKPYLLAADTHWPPSPHNCCLTAALQPPSREHSPRLDRGLQQVRQRVARGAHAAPFCRDTTRARRDHLDRQQPAPSGGLTQLQVATYGVPEQAPPSGPEGGDQPLAASGCPSLNVTGPHKPLKGL